MNQRSNYFIGESGKLIKFDAHKVPVFKEEKTKDWVIWGFEKTNRKWNNRYGDYLIWLYNSSAKNNAIINGKNTYIVGDGWSISERGLDLNDKIQAGGFKVGLESSKITRDISLDRIIFGGFATEAIPTKDGKKINMHHIDFSKIRVGKTEFIEEGEDKGKTKPTKYFFTSDWTVQRPENNPDWIVFHDFPWDLEALDSDKRYIVYYKDYRPDLQEYPLPEYIGAIPYINADYEISNFTFNNVKNGFSAGYLVNFYNGDPSEDQKADIEKRWKQQKHGGDNAGDPILSFNEDKDSGVEVTPLPANGQDDRFLALNEQIRDEIYTGHNFNPTLIGLKNATGFNNNADELRVAGEMLQNTYVTKQQEILEDFVNSWANLNGIKAEFEIKRLKPITDPITETELAAILTINERREKAGFGPLDVETNQTTEALSTLSPLLATKVLEVMSLEEIRNLVGLTGSITTTTETLTKKFSKQELTFIELAKFVLQKKEDEIIIKHFSMCGINDEELIIMDSRQLHFEDINDARTQGDKFKFESKKANVILGLLIANQAQTQAQLAELTGLSGSVVGDLLNELEGEKLIDSTNTPTERGLATQQQVFVVYKYELRTDAEPLKGGVSREFCQNLMALSQSRSWTLADIELLNNGQGLDVFTSRGGFYTLPDSDPAIRRPFCRHIWSQRLVTRR